jgi:hypothetical protein
MSRLQHRIVNTWQPTLYSCESVRSPIASTLAWVQQPGQPQVLERPVEWLSVIRRVPSRMAASRPAKVERGLGILSHRYGWSSQGIPRVTLDPLLRASSR